MYLWTFKGKERDRDRERDRKWQRLKMIYSFHMFWPLPSLVYILLASWRTSCLTQLFNFESPTFSKTSNSRGFHCLFWEHPWLFLSILENHALICNYPMWWEKDDGDKIVSAFIEYLLYSRNLLSIKDTEKNILC